MTVDLKFTIAERVEGALFGDIRHREGNFEAVAAEVLRMSQAEVDAALAKETSAIQRIAAKNLRQAGPYLMDPVDVSALLSEIDRLKHELMRWSDVCTGRHGSQQPCRRNNL